MGIRIEKAKEEEIDEVTALYGAVCQSLTKTVNYPGWKENIYPTKEEALDGFKEDSLFVLKKEGVIAGTMILNGDYEPGYQKGNWQYKANDEEILVIHTLAIHPNFNHQGLAHHLVSFAKEYGKQNGKKVIRIDVTDGNEPAIALYLKQGFTYAGKVDLGRSEHGIDWFQLYEFLLV